MTGASRRASEGCESAGIMRDGKGGHLIVSPCQKTSNLLQRG